MSGSRIWSGAGRCTSGPCLSGSARTGLTSRTSAGRRTEPGDRGSHPGRGRSRLSGDAGRRRARDGTVRAAGFPGPGRTAARPGRGAAAGRGALRGRGRQAGPVGEGPRRAADRVLLPAAGRLEGVEPRWMHLALGNGEFASFKVDDFAAYERQTRRLLAAALGGDPAAEVYPEPVEHCAICRWRDMCRERRRTDDDLSLVAGMTTGQRRVGAAGRRFRGNVWRDRARRFRGNVPGPGAGAAGLPARLAPARGQAGLVALLLPPHAEPGRTDRRAGRAGRPGRRRGGRPGQEVGGATVRFPGAGTHVLRGRHGL